MHSWTTEENFICCEEYLKYSLKDIELKPVTPLLNKLIPLLPNISPSSIKCALQNIRYLCEIFKVPNFINISYRTNYSSTNKYVFYYLLLTPEINKLILSRKEDLQKKEEENNKNKQSITQIRQMANSFRNKKF